MPRLRRYLPPLLILLPVLFIGGKLLLVQVDDREHYLDSWEVGWPWVYRRIDKLAPTWNVYFSVGWLLADVAMMVAAIMAVVALLMLWYRRTLGRWQFSIRGLLVGTLLAAAAIGWFMQHEYAWRRQQHYLSLWQESGMRLVGYEDRRPQWVRRLLPESMQAAFERGTMLDDSYCTSPRLIEARDAALGVLDELPDVSQIEFTWSRSREPVQFQNPEALGRIEGIACCADDETLRALCELPNLRDLNVDGPITDRGMEHLRSCRSLERLDVYSDKITDAGIRVVFDLPRLKELDIGGCKGISRETIDLLKKRFPTVY